MLVRNSFLCFIFCILILPSCSIYNNAKVLDVSFDLKVWNSEKRLVIKIKNNSQKLVKVSKPYFAPAATLYIKYKDKDKDKDKDSGWIYLNRKGSSRFAGYIEIKPLSEYKEEMKLSDNQYFIIKNLDVKYIKGQYSSGYSTENGFKIYHEVQWL